MLYHRPLNARLPERGRCMLLALSLVVTSACASVRVHAPTQSMCLPDTADYSLSYRDWLVEVVTGTDTASAASRRELDLPAGPASEVAIIRDKKLCATAAQVMAAQYNRPEYPVVLIRVGTRRYFVYDGETVSGVLAAIVVDQNFAVRRNLVTPP